jgi:hypothetical protein
MDSWAPRMGMVVGLSGSGGFSRMFDLRWDALLQVLGTRRKRRK